MFDTIKEDISHTPIFIHENGLREDITNYLTDGVCNVINQGKISELDDSCFVEMTPTELADSYYGSYGSGGQTERVKLPRQDQLVIYQYCWNNMLPEVKTLLKGNSYE